jgi:hypothetical protein
MICNFHQAEHFGKDNWKSSSGEPQPKNLTELKKKKKRKAIKREGERAVREVGLFFL